MIVGIRALRPLQYVMVESPFAAGLEPIEQVVDQDEWEVRWSGRREVHKDRVAFALNELDKGSEQRLIYHVRAVRPGKYHVTPAKAFAMYEPDVRGHSSEGTLRVIGASWRGRSP